MQDRREFIKRSCSLCLSLAGMGTIMSQLAACSPMPVFKTEIRKGLAEVPLASFTEKNKMVIVRDPKLEFDIVAIKSGNAYKAIQLKCTHQDNPLTATQTGFFCSAHGSSFDLDGNVTKEPALTPLKKYATEIREQFLIIHIDRV